MFHPTRDIRKIEVRSRKRRGPPWTIMDSLENQAVVLGYSRGGVRNYGWPRSIHLDTTQKKKQDPPVCTRNQLQGTGLIIYGARGVFVFANFGRENGRQDPFALLRLFRQHFGFSDLLCILARCSWGIFMHPSPIKGCVFKQKVC